MNRQKEQLKSDKNQYLIQNVHETGSCPIFPLCYHYMVYRKGNLILYSTMISTKYIAGDINLLTAIEQIVQAILYIYNLNQIKIYILSKNFNINHACFIFHNNGT